MDKVELSQASITIKNTDLPIFREAVCEADRQAGTIKISTDLSGPNIRMIVERLV